MNPYKVFRNLYQFRSIDKAEKEDFLSALETQDSWESESKMNELLVGQNAKYEAEAGEKDYSRSIEALENRGTDFAYIELPGLMKTEAEGFIQYQEDVKQNKLNAIQTRKDQIRKEIEIQSKKQQQIEFLTRKNFSWKSQKIYFWEFWVTKRFIDVIILPKFLF